MERTVGYLVMASGPGFRNRRQLGVCVDVAGTGAVLQFAAVVAQAFRRLLMRLRLERVCVAATTARPVGSKLPRGLVRVGRMTGRAGRRTAMLARILGRGVCKRHHRPVRIVMARGAIERCRHVVGDFPGGRTAVVATLAIGEQSRMIEAGRAPRQSAVTCAAVLGSWHVVARHRCGPNP